jgi:hypothetical protein
MPASVLAPGLGLAGAPWAAPSGRIWAHARRRSVAVVDAKAGPWAGRGAVEAWLERDGCDCDTGGSYLLTLLSI